MLVELAKSVLYDFATEFVDTRTYPNDESLDVGFYGFAKVTLSGNSLTLDYVDLKGTVVFGENLDDGLG